MSNTGNENVGDASKEVMSWEDAIKAKAQQQQQQRQALAHGPKFISFRSGQLTVDKVAIPGNELDVIVLTFIGENAYYPGKYDSTVQAPPTCYAMFDNAADMAPMPDVTDKQNDICETCPNYQWGSDPAGGRGKACKTRYRIAMMPAPKQGATEADILSAEVRFAVLPVTSVKSFEQFATKAQQLFGRPIFGVVAKLSVRPDAKSQFLVDLQPIEVVFGPLLIPILARIDEAEREIRYSLANDDVEPAAPTKPAKPLK